MSRGDGDRYGDTQPATIVTGVECCAAKMALEGSEMAAVKFSPPGKKNLAR